MVLAIIGCVFAAIQVLVAAIGAANVKYQYSTFFNDNYICDYYTDYCTDVSRFTRYKDLRT